MANVAQYSFKESTKLAWWTGKDIRTASPKEMTIALVQALEKHPDEYILYYALCDRLEELGLFAAAMEICKKLYELRPDDIRSSYAMATNYYCLTRPPSFPTFPSSPFSETKLLYFRHLPKKIFEMIASEDLESENEKLGIDKETAAREAIRWFKKTLELKPDNESLSLLTQHLNALHSQYPNFK